LAGFGAFGTSICPFEPHLRIDTIWHSTLDAFPQQIGPKFNLWLSHAVSGRGFVQQATQVFGENADKQGARNGNASFVIVGAGLLSMAGFAGAASAADLPARTYTKAPAMIPAVYDWSGVYIGINGGGGSSRNCYTITTSAGVPVNPNSEGCHDATGGMVGGQLGYRWQSASWVFGVEAMGDWADLKGTNPSLIAIVPYINQTKIDAIGLFTGQVGYAWNNVLWYVKGGAAVTDNKYCSYFTATNTVFNSANDTRWGGAVGTGVEISFAPNWSVGFEYDHLFMDTHNVVFAPTGVAVGRTDNLRQDVDMGTVRINYRFGGPVIAKY
jgi:outer membrane immunogenic protein